MGQNNQKQKEDQLLTEQKKVIICKKCGWQHQQSNVTTYTQYYCSKCGNDLDLNDSNDDIKQKQKDSLIIKKNNDNESKICGMGKPQVLLSFMFNKRIYYFIFLYIFRQQC